MPASAQPQAKIFIVSDGTGDTVRAVVNAAMLQFQVDRRTQLFSDVRHVDQARRIVEEAEAARALIVFTVVDKHVATTLRDEANQRGVPVIDILGPVISKIADHLRAEPRAQPGLLHGVSDEYFRRIEAVEFAVRHDDGANLHTLHGADLALTGVSRTSKTPLSMYLAQRGYKTGNVPFVPDHEPPQPLLDLDPSKVFALTIEPRSLISIRQARMKALGAAPYVDYADPGAVIAEIREARRLFRKRGWRVIDISGRAVEENAARILSWVE